MVCQGLQDGTQDLDGMEDWRLETIAGGQLDPALQRILGRGCHRDKQPEWLESRKDMIGLVGSGGHARERSRLTGPSVHT